MKYQTPLQKFLSSEQCITTIFWCQKAKYGPASQCNQRCSDTHQLNFPEYLASLILVVAIHRDFSSAIAQSSQWCQQQKILLYRCRIALDSDSLCAKYSRNIWGGDKGSDYVQNLISCTIYEIFLYARLFHSLVSFCFFSLLQIEAQHKMQCQSFYIAVRYHPRQANQYVNI